MRALPVLMLAACAAQSGGGEPAPDWADEVLSAPSAGDRPFGDPELAVDGARGGGWFAGGVDVYALLLGEDDELIVGFSGRYLVDVDGPDLVVFENPFALDDGSRFMDPVVVEVSPDGEDWVAFPHDYVGPPEGSMNPDDWLGFGGVTPTLLHEDENPVDPFAEVGAGGDRFDLADLPDGPVTERIRATGALAVRLTPAVDAGYPRDPAANGPDLDGVYGRALLDPTGPTTR